MKLHPVTIDVNESLSSWWRNDVCLLYCPGSVTELQGKLSNATVSLQKKEQAYSMLNVNLTPGGKM